MPFSQLIATMMVCVVRLYCTGTCTFTATATRLA